MSTGSNSGANPIPTLDAEMVTTCHRIVVAVPYGAIGDTVTVGYIYKFNADGSINLAQSRYAYQNTSTGTSFGMESFTGVMDFGVKPNLNTELVPCEEYADPSAGVIPDKVVNHFAANIASGTFSGTHDPMGNGDSWTYAGSGRLQSVTVTALEATDMSTNYIEIVSSGVTKAYLLKGQSITFSVSQDSSSNEQLKSDMVVNCSGDAAAFVAWTEDQ